MSMHLTRPLFVPPSPAAFAARHPALFLVAAAVAFTIAWLSLVPVSEVLVSWLPVAQDGPAGRALAFFFYDAPKVLLLLSGIVLLMGIVNTHFTPERTRALLSGHRGALGNVLAAGLGIVTPFCSCSAVPLFLGFVQAGVPLGITFSFLISAPMVNEIALTLLFGLFGFRIAALYLALGLTVAIVSGLVIGRLRLEHLLEDWVRDLPPMEAPGDAARLTWGDRVVAGLSAVREVVGRVWLYVIAGIAVGAAIHGYVPAESMSAWMGSDNPWAVPAAVALGVPMYSNAAGIIPIVEALLAKGAALGTVLAFMMSVIALSLPEMIILRKVLKVRLIAAFAGIVAAGIVLVGYVFNAVL
jgi:uncharacterized membrane protein YraQ (UPF0718 family)